MKIKTLVTSLAIFGTFVSSARADIIVDRYPVPNDPTVLVVVGVISLAFLVAAILLIIKVLKKK